MFDVGPTELLLIVVVAVIVIGPKDLPMALRTAGRWIGRMRKISAQFRTGLDSMIREAEMQELEQKWKAQNEKIMRDHPADAKPEMEPTGAYPASPVPLPAPPVADPPAVMEPIAPALATAPPDEPQLPLGSADKPA
ncbi:MAG: Sec-independent protein translocase protein TatB [Croceibacterium sp.]